MSVAHLQKSSKSSHRQRDDLDFRTKPHLEGTLIKSYNCTYDVKHLIIFFKSTDKIHKERDDDRMTLIMFSTFENLSLGFDNFFEYPQRYQRGCSRKLEKDPLKEPNQPKFKLQLSIKAENIFFVQKCFLHLLCDTHSKHVVIS